MQNRPGREGPGQEDAQETGREDGQDRGQGDGREEETTGAKR
jgi:hypothetical protein